MGSRDGRGGAVDVLLGRPGRQNRVQISKTTSWSDGILA